MKSYAMLTAAALGVLVAGCSTDPTVPHPVVDAIFPYSDTAVRDSTSSTTAQPAVSLDEIRKLDLSKYDVATVMPFGVEPGKDINPIYGTKFAGDVYGRLKHDFGNLFTEVRFGEPEGKTNELIVTGTIKTFSEGTALGLLNGPLLWRSSNGTANLDADLILRDGATQQIFFTADVNKLWGFEEWLRGAQNIDRKRREAAATVANTIARGRGWHPPAH